MGHIINKTFQGNFCSVYVWTFFRKREGGLIIPNFLRNFSTFSAFLVSGGWWWMMGGMWWVVSGGWWVVDSGWLVVDGGLWVVGGG